MKIIIIIMYEACMKANTYTTMCMSGHVYAHSHSTVDCVSKWPTKGQLESIEWKGDWSKRMGQSM